MRRPHEIHAHNKNDKASSTHSAKWNFPVEHKNDTHGGPNEGKEKWSGQVLAMVSKSRLI